MKLTKQSFTFQFILTSCCFVMALLIGMLMQSYILPALLKAEDVTTFSLSLLFTQQVSPLIIGFSSLCVIAIILFLGVFGAKVFSFTFEALAGYMMGAALALAEVSITDFKNILIVALTYLFVSAVSSTANYYNDKLQHTNQMETKAFYQKASIVLTDHKSNVLMAFILFSMIAFITSVVVI